MREIKFRAWDRVQNVMRGWDWLKDKQGTYLNSKYFHAMQYTGLYDKNGKEIYEGDIVSSTTYKVVKVISFNEECQKFLADGYEIRGSKRWTVIGNIYENPKLIKTI